MYHEYAKHIGGDEFVLNWVKTTLANHLKENQPSTEEVEHVLDFLVSDSAPKRINKMSYEQAHVAAEKWNKALQKKGADIKESDSDVETVLDFKDGFRIVKLVGENAYKREGFLMRHCVGSYYGRGDVLIFSLRDADNNSHATLEIS